MSNDYVDTFDIESEFDSALQHHVKDRDIERRSWEAYSGFDYGQWPEKAKQELMRSNRHIIQLNLIRGKVNTLAGSIAKNGLELDFVPVNEDATEATKVLKGLFYSDREMLNWDQDYIETVKDGLVHRGVEEMYIDERYSPLGNIGFKRCQPGHIILDPEWKSHDSRDLRRVWKVAYLTAKQIKEMYPAKSDIIDGAIYSKMRRISDFEDDPATESMDKFNLEQLYGDLYRVVEYHCLKEKKVKSAVYSNGETNEDITGYTDEQIDAYVAENDPENNGRVIKKTKVVKEYWVTTTCNQLLPLGEVLENAKSEIQIGRLPFFPWSSARINGRDSGIVSLLLDAQQAINKRESLSDHIIASSAHGAMAVDSALFNGDQGKTREALKEMNKPNAKIVTPPGTLSSGRNYFYQIPKSQYHGEIYQEIDRMRGHLDAISQSTATLEGRNESSHDTGILFARRQMQSEIALTTLTASLEQHWNNKGEAYMLLAQDLYSGAYRKFKSDFGIKGDDKQTIELNNGYLSLEDMPRHKVVISQSPRGITLRETERAINSEILQRIPPEQMLYRATISRNIMNTLDLTGDEKKRLDEATEIEYQLALKDAQLRMAGMDTQLNQMAMQQQMMLQGPPPQQEEQMQEAEQPVQQ